MKNRTLIFTALILILFMPGTANKINAQGTARLAIGMGIPEFLNLDARICSNSSQLRLGFGILPLTEESLISISGDLFIHLWGTQELSELKSWYLRTGLNYVRDETDVFLDRYVYLSIRPGREYMFSERFGMDIDIGVLIELWNEEIRYQPDTGWNFDFNFPVLPALGFSLFYRIL